MKNVLLITYYWPPSNSPGVHRWLRMSKYMYENGYNLAVITPENPHYQDTDEHIKADDKIKVIKLPIFEVTRLLEKISGKKTGTALLSEKKTGTFSKFLKYIRGNFFIPDPKKYWIKPTAKYLTKYIIQNNIDLIITTGPPHSLHLIGLQLQEKTGVKWMADFRDPWTNIDFYKELQLSSKADNKHHELEKEVITKADMVSVIGPTMQKEMYEIGAKKCITVTNGFSFTDKNKTAQIEHYTIAHYGSMSAARNPLALWRALKEINKEYPSYAQHIKIKLIGSIDFSVKQSIIDHNLEAQVEFIQGISHAESIEGQQKEALLLLIANNSPNAKGILTGKFFEYLNASRPILALGPLDGDLAHAINQSKAGKTFDYLDDTGIKSYILDTYTLYQKEQLNNIEADKYQYDTKNIVSTLCRELDHLLI